jgi:hypothetical protein
MTSMTEILTVADHFDIRGRGLVLAPDFDPPREGKWRNFSDTVVVLTPTGQRLELQADFTLIHFNIRDPNVDARKRWRVSVAIPSGTKQTIPIGSRLLCDANVRAALMGVGHT